MAGARRRGAQATTWRTARLVGRDELVDELTALARAAAAGSGSVVLLTGEAGIGKTSVARAVASRVREDLTVSWGACAPDRSAPPFWPWRDLADVAEPQAGAAAGDSADPAIGVPRFEHLRALGDAVLRGGPRLHVIEDLQWADVASVLLVVHVAAAIAEAPLVVICTVRTGEPMTRQLDAAIGEVRRGATVRAVAPLTDDAIAILVRDAGLDPDGGVASLVRARTGGNPLFVGEVLRAARAADPGTPLDAFVSRSVPAHVSDLIAQRLRRLPPAVADVVVTAAVVGSEGDSRTLATVTAADVESVVDLLEQARAARLLGAAAPGRWRFEHDLVRDAVYAGTGDALRARTHAAVVDALATDEATPPAVLAHHALAAQPLFDAERAIALAARAGEHACAQNAYEEAVGWFEQALAATTPELAPRWRAELLVRRGEAHRQLGELDAARRAFLDAAELTDDTALLARAALGYADPGADLGIAFRTEDAATGALLERAIAAQPASASASATAPSLTTVRLEARLAAELYFSGHPERSRELAEAAWEHAGRLGDPRALVAAGTVVHDAFVVGRAALDDQLRGSEQLLAWARESGSPAALLAAHRARVFDLLAAGDLAAMDAEIVAFRRIAEPLRAPGYLWWPAVWSAMRALLEGDHHRAEELANAAYAIGEVPFAALAMNNLAFLLFFLRREQGRLAELESATRKFAATHADVPALRVALAFLLAEIGRTDEARGMLAAIATSDLERLRDRNWPASWFQLARACALTGDRDLARALLDPVRRPTEQCVNVSLATVCLGAADLATAWLLHTAGDLDRADAHYGAAEAVNARIGARSWLAHARADHASLLLARGGPGDHDTARQLVDRAAAAAGEIGLRSLTEQLDALRDRVGSTTTTAAEPARAPIASTASFRRSGAVWNLDFAGRQAQVADARGLRDLAYLLGRPGEAVSVLELVGDVPIAPGTRGAPAFDERARREIRARLHELEAEIADAEADHDGEGAAVAREQLQQLAETVARDLGLGGRTRRVDDPVERARKTVSTRIRRTIAAIGRAHPDLGRHLERSVDTGTWCAYRPAEPVNWDT